MCDVKVEPHRRVSIRGERQTRCGLTAGLLRALDRRVDPVLEAYKGASVRLLWQLRTCAGKPQTLAEEPGEPRRSVMRGGAHYLQPSGSSPKPSHANRGRVRAARAVRDRRAHAQQRRLGGWPQRRRARSRDAEAGDAEPPDRASCGRRRDHRDGGHRARCDPRAASRRRPFPLRGRRAGASRRPRPRQSRDGVERRWVIQVRSPQHELLQLPRASRLRQEPRGCGVHDAQSRQQPLVRLRRHGSGGDGRGARRGQPPLDRPSRRDRLPAGGRNANRRRRLRAVSVGAGSPRSRRGAADREPSGRSRRPRRRDDARGSGGERGNACPDRRRAPSRREPRRHARVRPRRRGRRRRPRARARAARPAGARVVSRPARRLQPWELRLVPKLRSRRRFRGSAESSRSRSRPTEAGAAGGSCPFGSSATARPSRIRAAPGRGDPDALEERLRRERDARRRERRAQPTGGARCAGVRGSAGTVRSAASSEAPARSKYPTCSH